MSRPSRTHVNLAIAINGRDDSDALSPEELVMMSDGITDIEEASAILVAIAAVLGRMRGARTVGDARDVIQRIEAIDAMMV